MPYFSRKNPRLLSFDYSSENYYFITFCSHEKKCIFGTPSQLNQLGRIAYQDMQNISHCYKGVKVDHFVIMPNHVHAIVILEGEEHPSIGSIVGAYRAGVTRKIRNFRPDMKVWQRNYYDRVIRNQKEYENIWYYIEYNPIRWEEDDLFPEEIINL